MSPQILQWRTPERVIASKRAEISAVTAVVGVTVTEKTVSENDAAV